jgi:hypothetical protein
MLMRLLWVSVAAAIALLASLFFHRFDPARSWHRQRAHESPAVSKTPSSDDLTVPSSIPIAAAHLTPLIRTSPRSRFLQLVMSELRLMIKGQRWWWYVGAAGMLIGELVSPEPNIRSGFLVAAWLWPVLLWSQMGCREARSNTSALLFSSERSLSRQLPALWTAGVLLAFITGAGVGIRLALAADWHSFTAWLVGALFIPSFALALGIWSGGSRAFEAIYTVWWYIGPAHQMPGLDFMGTTPASSSPVPYLLATIALLAVSYWGRRRRLAYA